MDDDDRELANRLFAAMTAMLEDAAEAAAAGQPARAAPAELAAQARRIRATGHEVAALAEAALVIAKTHPENG